MTRAVTYVEVDIPSFTVDSPESIETFRFAIPSSYLSNTIDAIPSIDSISFTPQRISLGENLGQRASLKITFRDHRHVFAGEDYSSGTFFGKWRARYGNKLRGRALRIYNGEEGQALSNMDVRHYVIDSCNGPLADATYTITAKDPLKYADDDRAQAPYISNGSLAGSITIVATTATLSPTGIGDLEYPASGYVCIGGKEICSFTRVSDTLTLVRARLGTTAEAHDAAERVQLVLQYTGNDVADIIYDLLVNYASVPAEYIPLTEWQSETANYMNGVIYAANISDAVSVRTLLNELIQQAVIVLYWDDRANQIRLKVIREISTDTNLFDDYNIIAGSFGVTDQDAKRLSEVWCYYTQRNPTDTGAKEDNFKNVLVDLDLGRETEYGGSMIRKTQCRWIQTEAAASRYTLLQLGRYKDPPRSYAFDVVAGTSVSPAVGYTLEWWGEQDTLGNRASVPIQITQVTMYPDRVHVEAEEMLVDGSIVVSLLNIMFVYTGTTTVARPATWNDADNSIHAISSGSCGDCHDNTNRKGGGGAAWAALDNYTMAASVSCSVGAAQTNATAGYGVDGQPTWFVSTGTLYADYPRATGVGGQAASSIGDRKYSGGNGGSYNGGGGGAGGPHGAGANGGNGVFYPSIGGGGGGADGGYPGANGSGDTPGDGGNNRYNFGGGTSGSPNGSEGGGGRGGTPVTHAGNGGDGEQIWTQTTPPIVSAGPGGGSGGKFPSTAGRYGGGAGAAYDAHSSADGLLVLVWRTV